MALSSFLKGRGSSAGYFRGKGVASSVSRLDIKERIRLFEDYEASGQGWFWATDGQGRISYITEGVAAELGVAGDAIVGQPLSSIFVLERDDSAAGVERPLGFLLSARNTISDMTVRAASDDKELWWLISGKPKFDSDGEFLGYRGHGKDVTARRQTEHDASRLAMYDSLTGLANRHRMSQQLGTTLTAYRVSRRSCALMMLDLDRFKHVNDTLGHPAGDELLKQVAQRLMRVIGEKCEIGRLGGDEFQVIIPESLIQNYPA